MDEQLDRLLWEVERLKDVHKIQNMISTTSYMFAIGEYSTIYGFFSKERADVTAEVTGFAKKSGHEAVNEFLVTVWKEYERNNAEQLHKTFPEDEIGEGRNGLLDLRALTSPVIEVAEDRQTAKGLWLVPGTQTFAGSSAQLPQAHWVWTKLAMDFVPERGQWRIWHMIVTPVFAAPYNTSWVDSPTAAENAVPTYVNPYTVHSSYPHPPAPPKPYRTFMETFSY